MGQNETEWDRLLRIKTGGRDDSQADQYNYPYEPTPYNVLERLALSEYIGKRNILVDYGCGKGRVDFFMSYQTRCRTVGIEYDVRIFEKAQQNQADAISGARTEFHCVKAQDYEVDAACDRFYFFNPFSVVVLQSVIGKICSAYFEKPREMMLFFYYPSDEYMSYLMTVDEILFVDEIDCMDLFEGNNPRERIVIFEVVI